MKTLFRQFVTSHTNVFFLNETQLMDNLCCQAALSERCLLKHGYIFESSATLRSTIRNAKSIHNRDRRRLSQDVYRKNSRRYLQHKGSQLTTPGTSTKKTAKSPLRERKNQSELTARTVEVERRKSFRHFLLCLHPTDNIVEQSGSSSEAELKKESPVIPPRPSPELILERCTDNTRRRVSIHLNSSSSG